MNFRELMIEEQENFGRIFSDEFFSSRPFVFNFTPENADLREAGVPCIDPNTMTNLTNYVERKMRENGARIGVGRYNERRVTYDTTLFTGGSDVRNIHLGIDLFVPAGTKIFAPVAGRVHSFNLNDKSLDYGPTIILQHEIRGTTFYTLYGHLSADSIENLGEGQEIAKGGHLASVGDRPINGDWTPHLHFQVMTDMGAWRGDYPGLSTAAEREKYLKLCPNPELILRLNRTT